MIKKSDKVLNDVLDYGLVKVTAGKHKGRIGHFDDKTGATGVVYFGEIQHVNYVSHDIQLRYLSSAITTEDLIARSQSIHKELISIGNTDFKRRSELLAEYVLVDATLGERWWQAKTLLQASTGKSVFISHSSQDKEFARWLAVDLANKSHKPWLDEWEIKAGQSIPTKIAEGVDRCDFLLIVLSPRSVESRWVENEWQSKYWVELQNNSVKVIPLLYERCKIPTLLAPKKYVDFTGAFSEGFEELLEAINSL